MNNFLQEVGQLRGTVKNTERLYLNCQKELLGEKDKQLLIRIYFECAKKIYPCWKSEFGDSMLILSLLQQIDLLLYHQKNTTRYIQDFIRNNQSYFEVLTGRLQLMGWVFMGLCHSIVHSESWEKEVYRQCGVDTGDIRKVLPDFLAARVWAGERKRLSLEGDSVKKREFWRWYLNMTYQIGNKPDCPLLQLEERDYIVSFSRKALVRTQHSLTEDIEACFKAVALLIVNDMAKKDWDCIEITMIRLDDSSMEICREYQGKKFNHKLSVKLTNDLYGYMECVHKEMYRQALYEGAWLVCQLRIYPDQKYEVKFNYDDLRSIPVAACHPAAFVIAFRNYPRSRNYTPQWWQELLGKNAKYLE